MGKLATCRLKRRIVFIPEEDAASTTENVSERIIKGLLKEFGSLFDHASSQAFILPLLLPSGAYWFKLAVEPICPAKSVKSREI
jgi:hypothetical protein